MSVQRKPRSPLRGGVLITILISAILFGGGGYYLGTQAKTDSTATTKTDNNDDVAATATPTATPKASPSASPATTTKTYTNSTVGFSFQYPQSFKLYESWPATEISGGPALVVNAQKVNELGDDPLGYDRETALRDKEALAKEDVSVSIGMPLSQSRKLIAISNALAKEDTTLRILEVCDVTLNRKAVICELPRAPARGFCDTQVQAPLARCLLYLGTLCTSGSIAHSRRR